MTRAAFVAIPLALALVVSACRGWHVAQVDPRGEHGDARPVHQRCDAAPPLLVPTPLPTAAPDLDGPPCSAADTELIPDSGNGAGGHSVWYIRVVNRSNGVCVLGGLPIATAGC